MRSSSTRSNADTLSASIHPVEEPHRVTLLSEWPGRVKEVVIGTPVARGPKAEVLGVFLMVSAMTLLVTQLRHVPAAAEYVSLAVAAIFLWAALWRIPRKSDELKRFGVYLGGLLAPTDPEQDPGPLGIYDMGRLVKKNAPSALREIGVATLLSLIIFPPFLFAFGWWHGAEGLPEWDPRPGLGSFVLAQVVIVALPEEVFFRGYVQTRLADHFGPSPWRHLPVHPAALVLQSVLFAVVHLITDLNPARLAVFFPGLVFGLLRGWRGGVGAAIIFHALSNIYSDLLFSGWLR